MIEHSIIYATIVVLVLMGFLLYNLNKGQRLLSRSFLLSPQSKIIVDQGGTIISMNQAAINTLPVKDFNSNTCYFDIIDPISREEEISRFRRQLEKKREKDMEIVNVLRPDQTIESVILNSSIISNGEVVVEIELIEPNIGNQKFLALKEMAQTTSELRKLNMGLQNMD